VERVINRHKDWLVYLSQKRRIIDFWLILDEPTPLSAINITLLSGWLALETSIFITAFWKPNGHYEFHGRS
jgi:hypothetical protein